MRTLGVALGMVLSFAPSVQTANATLITFDDRPGMSNSPGSLVPAASQLSNQYLASTGALFSSLSSPFVAVVDLMTCCGPNSAISNPNGIGGVDVSGRLSYGTPFNILFFEPGSALPGVTDFVQIRGDQIAIVGTASMTAFGVDDLPIGSTTAPDTAGGLTLSLSLPGIRRVVLSETSATIAFDQLEFNAPVAASTAVPEPSSLLLLGTSILVVLARTRRIVDHLVVRPAASGTLGRAGTGSASPSRRFPTLTGSVN
jgi:hypothetical protein